LDANSPTGVLSARVLATIPRRPGSWILFYSETALLWAASLAAAGYGMQRDITGPAFFAPVYVAALFLYARLLGRLGWVLSESMPANEVTTP